MSLDNKSLQNYLYDLPDERIAKHPLANREDSKLLHYKNGQISHQTFNKVEKLIPDNSLLFLNNTKVIAARLFFRKETGAHIEVFLTEPVLPHPEYQKALKVKNNCTWKCMIGNLKKWKDDQSITLQLNDDTEVMAKIVDRSNLLVEFTWSGNHEFLEIIESAGHVPLPPYLNREEEAEDKSRYQTVFSEHEGAVAAPTAGLHFTDQILKNLASRGVKQDKVTLHVSAGTFRPIKADDFKNHDMHKERIIVNRRNVENILHHSGHIVPVGTTALRTLESLYWYGAKLTLDNNSPFKIEKDDPYQPHYQGISKEKAMLAILEKFDKEKNQELRGETEVFIYPGYDFKVASALFTNFHMPGSTLILLVAAFVGDDWKEIYREALANEYRFLSYGDTSLLIPDSMSKPKTDDNV